MAKVSPDSEEALARSTVSDLSAAWSTSFSWKHSRHPIWLTEKAVFVAMLLQTSTLHNIADETGFVGGGIQRQLAIICENKQTEQQTGLESIPDFA